MKFTNYALVSCCLTALLVSGCGGGGSSGPVVTSDRTLSAGAPANPTLSAVSPSGAMNWTMVAGDSSRDQALVANDFFPDTITIDAGDSITWTARGNGHTISFPGTNGIPGGPPTVSVGLGNGPNGTTTYDGTNFVNAVLDSVPNTPESLGPATFTLTFTKAGTYPYLCQLHMPEMKGVVVVQPRGTAYPRSQGSYTGSGLAEINAQLSDAQQSLQTFPYPIGGPTIAAGISPPLSVDGSVPNASVLRYLDDTHLGPHDMSSDVVVQVGTTVTWVNKSANEPHTITFFPGGVESPQNPFSPPTGQSTFDGTQLVGSGPLFPGQRFQLTFVTRGTFKYVCLFHALYKMDGTITVL